MSSPGTPSGILSDQVDAARFLPKERAAHGAPPLPESYGIARLVLMVRDPHALFAYWELPEPAGPLWLCVYETNPAGEGVGAVAGRFPVGTVGRYHLHVPEGGRFYRAALQDDHGRTLLLSNVVVTPPGRPSELEEAEWIFRGVLSRWSEAPGGPTSPGLSRRITEEWLSSHRPSSFGYTHTSPSPQPGPGWEPPTPLVVAEDFQP